MLMVGDITVAEGITMDMGTTMGMGGVIIAATAIIRRK
jgi:hypothetical protein